VSAMKRNGGCARRTKKEKIGYVEMSSHKIIKAGSVGRSQWEMEISSWRGKEEAKEPKR